MSKDPIRSILLEELETVSQAVLQGEDLGHWLQRLRDVNHADLVVEIEHDEPNAPHGLELIESAAPCDYPDVPPGSVTLAEAGADIEPVEVERLVVPPGGVARVQMRHATHLRLREVSMHEAYDDA